MANKKIKTVVSKSNVIANKRTLPEEILCLIISFLPLTEAVRICLLLKGWSQMLTSLSNLDFDDSSKKTSFKARSFMTFVDTVLYRHQRLDKIRLSCHKSVDPSRLDGWIRHALWLKVKELDLVVNYGKNKFDLTAAIFTCKTLVAFKLDLLCTTNFILKVPKTVRLPNLKILHLKNIKISDDGSNRRLISSCSALEELVIDGCTFKRGCKFIISNESLKRLTLSFLYCFQGDHTIAIDAPSLVYFNCDCIPKTFIPINMKSVLEAHIELATSCDNSDGSCVIRSELIHSEAIIKLLQGITEVQSLHLSGSFAGDFPKIINQFPLLPKLTSLRVDAQFYIGWEKILPGFLYCFPSIKSLALKINPLNLIDLDHSDDLPIPDKFPFYVSNQLKTVAFSSFQGNKTQLQMVEYFLKYAKVLETLTVQTKSKSMRQKLSLRRQVSKLPKVSEDCEILVF